MTEQQQNLGRVVSQHTIAAIYLQRAAIVALLSLFFFLAMLFAFYIRRHFGYFLLSTGFLVIYIVTFISWTFQKKNVLTICQNGIRYKKFSANWRQIKEARVVSEKGGRLRLELTKGPMEKAVVPSSLTAFDHICTVVGEKVGYSS